MPSLRELTRNLFTSDQAQVVATVGTIFQAARADDLEEFQSLTASDFYLFDRGARFNGDAMMALIKAGKRYEWNVSQPEVHITATPLGLPT